MMRFYSKQNWDPA